MRPDDYRAALFESDNFGRLSRGTKRTLLELPGQKVDRALVETALKLPEQLSLELDKHCLVAWDEFQELGELTRLKPSIDIFALIRAIWQRHKRVGYFISGSKRTLLTELVTSPASPFFQHFSIIEVGPMPRREAVELLLAGAPPDRPIETEIASRTVEVLGGHPFYLQLFGEALTRTDPPYDDAALKSTLSELLFSSTGRLALYFQREYDKVVGRATTAAAVMGALAEGPLKPGEIAKAIKAGSGDTTRYLERLKDAVRRREDGRVEIADPVFALWIRWSKPGGTVVPMTLVGNEAELAVAKSLAEMGFELVYQSRASRGAFDLLGIRSGRPLGIQVKRADLPIGFKKMEWNRLKADAARFGWCFVIAQVEKAPSVKVRFLDPDKAQVETAVNLDESAGIANLLAWMSDSPTG